jgi:hypothetical protein
MRLREVIMDDHTRVRTMVKWTAGALGIAAGAYGGYVGLTWLRYGHPAPASPDEADALLDRFMPVHDIAERHHIEVAAPQDITFAAACEQDLMALPVARSIFKAREVLLGSDPDSAAHPRGLLAMTKSIGWGVLAEVTGREIVMGAVTQPWRANVVFRPLPPGEFSAFKEPDYVKVVWTLRADPAGTSRSIFRTETRAVATDATARAKFRRYWSFLSPGIILIRWAALCPLKREAERRAGGARLIDARSLVIKQARDARTSKSDLVAR